MHSSAGSSWSHKKHRQMGGSKHASHKHRETLRRDLEQVNGKKRMRSKMYHSIADLMKGHRKNS